LPLVLWLHGGGWTLGDVESYDRVCRRLAAGSGAAVLSLDYRLAPEHPWPASVDDTIAALRWISGAPEELGELTGRLAIAGDSAGATLSVLACLRVRDEAPAFLPQLQVLVYGNFDLSGSLPSSAGGRAEGDAGADVERYLISQWVPEESRWQDPDVSPYFAEDLAGLPRTVVVSAERDALRDHSSAMARRLRDAGVDVELRQEPGLIHDFLQLDEISPACAAAGDRVAEDLRTGLSA
jgi:acetyl esterase